MFGRVIGYLAVLLLTVYMYFMYNDTVISGILIFILFYPFCSAFCLLSVRNSIVPDLERVPAMGESGRPVKADIVLENRSRIFSMRYENTVSLKYSFDKKKRKNRYRGVLGPGEHEDCWCRFETDVCGAVELELESVRIYDPLGIFYIKKRIRRKTRVKIMPEFRLMPLEITKKTRDFQADAPEYSDKKKGNDPSELYQVREYRIQDSLKDIHWKMSAKEDQIMIKERGFPLGCAVLIWIDFPEKEKSAEGFSALLDTAASLSITLVEYKCIHMAAWYDEKEMQVVRCRIRDEESACEFIWELMDLQPYRDGEEAEICRKEAFRGQEFSSVVTLDGNGMVKKDGSVQEFLRL